MSETTDRIIALEKGFWTKAHDPRYFEENLADEAITVLEPVGFIDKSQGVKMTAKAPYTDVELHDIRIQELTPDCVVLAYHGQGRREGEKPYQGSIASTYIKRDGKWQLAITAHQPWKRNGSNGGQAEGGTPQTS